MSPLDDHDPPTFQFGRRRRAERRAEEAASAQRDRDPFDEAFGDDAYEDDGGDGLEIPSFDEPAPDPAAPGASSVPPRSARPFWKRLPLGRTETSQRVLIVIPWIAFAIAIVAIGGPVFMLAMIGLGILCMRELFRMTEPLAPVVIPGYLALAAMVIAAEYGTAFNIVLAFVCSFPVIFVFVTRRRSLSHSTVSIAITVLAIAWLGFGFAHATLLRELPDHGGALLVDVLIATFVGDTAAYGAGRLFGSRQITPRVSPNKTLEGLIGGFVGATMAFWFAGLYQDWLPGVDALLMGMAVAAIAPIGDLFASLIKRDLAVKDTGTLIGPHGGLLDRLDAVLFTVVVGYYLSVALVY